MTLENPRWLVRMLVGLIDLLANGRLRPNLERRRDLGIEPGLLGKREDERRGNFGFAQRVRPDRTGRYRFSGCPHDMEPESFDLHAGVGKPLA